jgi:hypothetical protein
MTYDESVTCQGTFGGRGSVITYANCDLITIGYSDGLSIDERHYDATTHEFVGARRGVDYDVWCGTERVLTIQAGVLPADDCQIAKVELPCSDAGTRR